MSSEFTPAEQQPQPDPWAASFWDSRFFLMAGCSLLLVVMGVVLIPFLGVAGLVLAVFSVLLGIGALLTMMINMMDAPGAPVAEDASPAGAAARPAGTLGTARAGGPRLSHHERMR